MPQNAAKFEWNPEREKAALLVAKDEQTDEQIAKAIGMERSQITRWKRLEAFQSRVEEHRKLWRDTLASEGLASQANRLAAYNDRWRRMQAVIDARAADPTMAEAPGAESGLLTRTYKSLGRGEDFQLLTEYAVDTGLLKELREIEKQAAMDLGQWTEKKEVTGKDGGPIAIIDVIRPSGARPGHSESSAAELPPGPTAGVGQ